MSDLHRSDLHAPGIRRASAKGAGRYVDARGRPVSAETKERIDGLAIPPAWREVWVSPDPAGHIQATGKDRAGRKQYIYHPAWRRRRDREKFRRMEGFARALPDARIRALADLGASNGDITKEQVQAGAFLLLDRGLFRLGSEEYARKNGTYGLATLLREHVRVSGETMHFSFRAKSGIDRTLAIFHPQVAQLVRRLRRRRGGPETLLAYRDSSDWLPLGSSDINLYVKDLAGSEFSAKDFRTWHATVAAAVRLSVASRALGPDETPSRRMVSEAVADVAEDLGNTPTVCRRSYIDPRVIDVSVQGRGLSQITLQRAEDEGEAGYELLEEAVLSVLEGEPRSSPA